MFVLASNLKHKCSQFQPVEYITLYKSIIFNTSHFTLTHLPPYPCFTGAHKLINWREREPSGVGNSCKACILLSIAQNQNKAFLV